MKNSNDFTQIRNRRKLPQLEKEHLQNIYKKSSDNIAVNGEKLDVFPLRRGAKLLSPLLFKHHTGCPR